VSWREVDDSRATAQVQVGPYSHAVTLTVAPDGRLTELVMTRWGNPDKEPFGEHVFGAALDGEATFDGFTIPRTIIAGWHYGTDRWPGGQFIRYRVGHAHFR
jgi:hypothetical protein